MIFPLQKSNGDWQTELANLITDPKKLLQELNLTSFFNASEVAQIEAFPLRVTQDFLARMQKGNPRDPLLLQVLPQLIEQKKVAGFDEDPLQEKQFNPVPGLLHKYHGRVLITLTGSCAIHCRYCFRRHFPYQENNPGKSGWKKLWEYISNDPSIHEVILSGGDPLLLNDKVLQQFTTQLSMIKHITRLRIHTRLPIVLPSRIDNALFSWIEATNIPIVMVVHVNHPNEISHDLQNRLLTLKKRCHYLLNQSVLLKDINDNVETLVTLSEKLFVCGISPYYLHVLDKVAGAAHFAVDEDEIVKLYHALAMRLPGFLVPKLVREEAGKGAKTLVKLF